MSTATEVRWSELDQWNFRAVLLRQRWSPRFPLLPAIELFTVRKTVVAPAALAGGEVKMVDRVTFGGEVLAGQRSTTKMTQYLAKPGDIVISKIRARQGSVGLVTEGMVSVSSHYRVLTPDERVLLPRFAWLALRSSYCRDEFVARTGGAMKGEISEEALMLIRVPAPPLSIQADIVARWEQERDAIASMQGELENLRREQTRALHDSLGVPVSEPAVAGDRVFTRSWTQVERWSIPAARAAGSAVATEDGDYPTVRLGDLAQQIQYGTSTKPNSSKRGLPIIRMSNIVDGVLALDDLKYVELPEREIEKLLLREGDLLFNRTNSQELVGKCAVFDAALTAVFASYLIRVVLDRERIDPRYASAILNSAVGRWQIDALSRKIIGQANINSAELRSLRVPLPPIDVQLRLVQEQEARRDHQATITAAITRRTADIGRLADTELFFDDPTDGLR